MTVAQENRKMLITEYLAPCLKRHGYKKKNNVFFQQSADAITLISIQNSSMTIPETCQFTINLGVYFPQLAELLEQPGREKFPSRAELGQINVRIGKLIPKAPGDMWWRILPDNDWRSVAQDVTYAVETFGVPWVECVASIKAAKTYAISERQYLMGAALALLDGKVDEARGYFEIRKAQETPIRQIWLHWAEKHGLIPN